MSQRVRMPILFCSFVVLVWTSALVLAQGTDVDPATERPVPVVSYVMASPRACLIGCSNWSDAVSRCPAGDADNFHRSGGSVRIPVGGKVKFSLSRNMEGVWYTGSYGLLGTVLEIQWHPLCVDESPSAVNTVDPRSTDARDSDGSRRWITVGKDGARDVRRGPSIGTAQVAVPVRFLRPGIYYMRGIVTTFASSFYPHTSDITPIPDAKDEDIIYVTVHVLPNLEPGEQPSAEGLDPDDASKSEMPNSLDGEPITVEAEIDGEEVVTWIDEG